MSTLPLLALLSTLTVGAEEAAALTGLELAQRDDLLLAFQQAFEGDGRGLGGRPACLTPLVHELKTNWRLFDAQDRARMTAALAPWKTDLVEQEVVRSPGGAEPGQAPPPPAPLEEESCFGRQGSEYLLTEHFTVEWSGSVTQDMAEDFAEWIEYSYEVEVEELGWTEPAGNDQYPILVYIYPNDGYAGAYTSVEWCGGANTYVPYMVIYSGCWASQSWAKTVAAHEFNHVLQFSTSFGPEVWYWEATAVWAEEQVYPDYDYWRYDMEYYTEYPYLGLNTFDRNGYGTRFYHMYGASIFNFALDNHFGGPDMVRQMWDYAKRYYYNYYGLWVVDNVEGIDLEFDDVFVDFIASNTVMDYDEQNRYPDLAIQDEIDSLPAEGSSSSRYEPESLGVNTILFDKDLGEEGEELHVVFDGEDGPDWYAVLVAIDANSVAEVVRLDLDSGGEGSGSIAFQGQEVYLVVSPKDDDAWGYHYDWNDSWEYSWSATLGAPVEDTGPTNPDDDTGFDLPARPEDGEGEDGETGTTRPQSCGCAAGGLGGAGLLALLPALAVRRRRRL